MTDQQAFQKVLERLENDAGEIIKLIHKEREKWDWLPLVSEVSFSIKVASMFLAYCCE